MQRGIPLVQLLGSGFRGFDDGLFQHFENRRGILVAQSHRHRFRVDRLRQGEQRSCAADVIGILSKNVLGG